MKTEKENMKLWNSVCVTNPADTKEVSQRGGFTSICAQSQIKEATKHFGAWGIGWGVVGESFTMITPTLCLYQASMFIGSQRFSISSSIAMKRDDADFAKKVATDAITKTLSRMGFNSDVFEGKFDDSKYVEQRVAEVVEEVSQAVALTNRQVFTKSIKALLGENTPTDVEAWRTYILMLCKDSDEKVTDLSKVDADSELWTRLQDVAIRLAHP